MKTIGKRAPKDFFKSSLTNLPTLIGGQAINIWATKYKTEEPALLNYLPFLSEDIDFYGSANDVRSIAKQLNAQSNISPPRGVAAGFVEVLSSENAEPLRYEILKQVNGLTLADCEKFATLEIDKLTIKVLVPPTLLKSKLANLRTLNQENRNDLKHTQIALLCSNIFITQSSKDLSERQLIKLYNYTHSVLNSPTALYVQNKYSLDFSKVLPNITKSSPLSLQKWKEFSNLRSISSPEL